MVAASQAAHSRQSLWGYALVPGVDRAPPAAQDDAARAGRLARVQDNYQAQDEHAGGQQGNSMLALQRGELGRKKAGSAGMAAAAAKEREKERGGDADADAEARPGIVEQPTSPGAPTLARLPASLLVRQGSNRRYRCGWPVSVSAVMPGVLACPVTGRYRGPRRCFWLMAARRERLQCVFGVWRPGQRGGAHSELGRRVSPAQLAGIPSVRHSRCS